MKSVSNTFNSFLRAHAFAWSVFTVLFAFFFFAGGLVVANGQTVGPNDSHIVNLYVDNQESSAPTRAANVGEFLDKAHIVINEGDKVEPSLKTTIDSDNFKVNVYRAKPVTIIDGITETKILSPERSPELIAKNAGLTTYPEDILKITTATNFVQDSIIGEKLTINRATPVTISLYGVPAVTYRSHVKTVGDLLKEKNIVPEAGATISPAAETPITPNMPIFISKFGKQVLNAEEPIIFETISTPDPNQPMGYKKINVAGKNGKKQVVYELSLKDGKEIGRVKLQEVISEQPVKQEMVVGTKNDGFSGDFAAALAKLRTCEGAYTSNTGNGYYGAYQFNLGTWRSNAPSGYENAIPSSVPPEVQDQAAANLYKRRGWSPWPACSKSRGLQDIYR